MSGHGVVQCTIVITTKLGVTVSMESYDSREQTVLLCKEKLEAKVPFTLNGKNEEGQLFTKIIPHDVIFDIDVVDFSALAKVKPLIRS